MSTSSRVSAHLPLGALAGPSPRAQRTDPAVGARAAGLVALWLVSLALYAWSWQWGYVGLLGLSVAHVILVYPLNWKTFIGIGGELRSRLASRPAAPA